MRSKVLSCLLSLSLMFFVGSGSSLTASAAEVSPDSLSQWILLPFNKADDYNVKGTFNTVSGTYDSSGGSFTSLYRHYSVAEDSSGVFPVYQSGHSYLFYFTGSIAGPEGPDITSGQVRYKWGDYSAILPFSNSSMIYYSHQYVNSTNTYVAVWQLNNINHNHIISTASQLQITFDSNLVSNGRSSWALYSLDITNNSQDEVDSIVAAINNQTSSLGGKIDGAADDIQQSIEDQYGGDPGSSFPVDDIITQHNEKMGVLSFSSDVLMQVLGLLSPDQTLSSELVFPSMSLTIAGQRNRVQLWPEYRFDLNTLKQHWPDFIGIMQSLTTALVWIFVLRYCYRVFEKYFLAGGGS